MEQQISEASTHLAPHLAHLKAMGEKMKADFENKVVPHLQMVGEKVKAAVEKAAAEHCSEGAVEDATPEQVLKQMQAVGEAAATAFVDALEEPSAEANVDEEQQLGDEEKAELTLFVPPSRRHGDANGMGDFSRLSSGKAGRLGNDRSS
jgi:hypothetical protein